VNIPLYRYLLRRSLPSVGAWVAILVFYQWLLIAIYPSVERSTAQLSAVLRALPKGLISAFGLRAGDQGLPVFLSSEFYGLIWILALIYFVASEASRIPAGMLERGQMTPLLLASGRRGGLVLAATAALLTEVLLLDGLSLLCAAWLIIAYGLPAGGMHWTALGLDSFLLMALVGSVGMVASCLIPRERTVVGVVTGGAVGFFALNLVAQMVPSWTFLEHLTPFSAYQPEALLGGQIPIAALIGITVLTAILVVTAIVLFERRDLRGA